MEGFQKIRLATQEIYQMLTLGGDANLEALDPLNPFKDGVAFVVRPPKKTWKQITNLSGGEKNVGFVGFGLRSAQLLSNSSVCYGRNRCRFGLSKRFDHCNLSKGKPSPLFVLNVDVQERNKNAQFIIISLRNNMFEKADWLIGIFKVNDCTNNVTLNPNFSQSLDDAENTDPVFGTQADQALISSLGVESNEPPIKRRRSESVDVAE
ncbi:SMC-N domain-containing protein [Aphelenchoides besseyi]|nr:SMC-N domain-containing protein [Aphelenchoides besseyi]